MDWFPTDPDFWNGFGVVGLSVFLLMLLIFGKGLTLNSRVKDRDTIIEKQDATIEWQRLTIDKKDEQIDALIGGTRVTTESLQKVSRAAEQIAGEGL